MQGASTDFKRNLLRGIAWDATDRALTLEAALKLACRGQYSKTVDGLFLTASSGNGFSMQFSLPADAAQFSPAIIAASVSQLYDIYEEACAELVADEIDEPTDDQRLARMLALLKPRNSASVDYSEMTQVEVA